MITSVSFFVLIFSVVLHELGHGYAALKLGDNTAKRLGRLTFNPIPHIDTFQTIILPLSLYFIGAPIFGGAKPVPVQPHNFIGVSPRKGMMIVAAAGPAVNLILGLIALAILHVIPHYTLHLGTVFLLNVLFINAILGIFNLLPIPPLDGSKILMGVLPREQAYKFMQIERYGLMIIFALVFAGVLGPVINFGFNFISNLLPHDLLILLYQAY